MRMASITAALLIGVAVPTVAQDTTAAQPATPAALTVPEAAIARAVVDRMPQDTATSFAPGVTELYCWTRITGAEGEATVHHVWFHGDNEVGNVELRVGGSPWRTWSRKTIPAEATGAWHVEVRDAAGNLLRRIDFTIG